MRSLIFFSILIVTLSKSYAGYSEVASKENLLKYMKENLSLYNQNLPALLNKWVRFDSVWIDDDKIAQSYTLLDIADARKTIPDSMITDYQKLILNQFCSEPSRGIIRDLEIPIVIKYYATNREFLFDLEVKGSDCHPNVESSKYYTLFDNPKINHF